MEINLKRRVQLNSATFVTCKTVIDIVSDHPTNINLTKNIYTKDQLITRVGMKNVIMVENTVKHRKFLLLWNGTIHE